MKIKIDKYKGNASSSFTGRAEGRIARTEFELDKLDKDDNTYIIELPVGTTAFNPSFYLGFFFKSINSLGIDKFEKKYNIIILDSDDGLKKQLSIDISEGRRHAINQMDSKGGGLLSFLK